MYSTERKGEVTVDKRGSGKGTSSNTSWIECFKLWCKGV